MASNGVSDSWWSPYHCEVTTAARKTGDENLGDKERRSKFSWQTEISEDKGGWREGYKGVWCFYEHLGRVWRYLGLLSRHLSLNFYVIEIWWFNTVPPSSAARSLPSFCTKARMTADFVDLVGWNVLRLIKSGRRLKVDPKGDPKGDGKKPRSLGSPRPFVAGCGATLMSLVCQSFGGITGVLFSPILGRMAAWAAWVSPCRHDQKYPKSPCRVDHNPLAQNPPSEVSMEYK